MNYKKLNEKSKKIIEKSNYKKNTDKKNNNTVANIIKSNGISKNSLEKQKVKNNSPDVKISFSLKTEQSQNKENVLSPKQATSNYINFTKRSINIKHLMTNQSEISKESNLITNNSAHRNSDFNSKYMLTQDKNVSATTKVSSTLLTNNYKNNDTVISKNLNKETDKQSSSIKPVNKEKRFQIDTNKTIDLKGSNKINNIINISQNKVCSSGKDTTSEVKTVTSKNNDNKFSLVSNSKKDTFTTDKDNITKKPISTLSSFNSKKTSVERSKNIVKNKLKIYNTECNSSKEKSNEKQKALDKNITNPSNQLLNSKSKNNIKNVKIDIHKKEINLVSSSIEKSLENDKNSTSKTTKNAVLGSNKNTNINFNAKIIKSLNSSNITPLRPGQQDKNKIVQLGGTKIVNNSRNIESTRTITQPITNNEHSKKDSKSERSIKEKYFDKLSSFEIEELKQYKEVFFLGKNIENEIPIFIDENFRKSNGAAISPLNENKLNSFDDENGNYLVKPGDQINYRYEIISELGKGSFGQAFKCYDHKLKFNCCIKIIRSEEKFTNQAKIEIRILEYISLNDKNDTSNIVKIKDHFIFRNHVCIAFELLDTNLYELIKSNNYSGLEANFIKEIANQLLNSISFLQLNNIIHCDLKPENILLQEINNYSIKVIDFGSSCFDDEKLYAYIQSRYYRAPEIILGLGYNVQIDMWSFGCILAELYTGFPIFPGENEFDQLNYMMEYIGKPPENIILSAKKREIFFDQDLVPIKKANSKGKIRIPNTKKFEDFLEGADDDLVDLIKKCLVWNPFKRFKPDEALKHKYFSNNLKRSFTNKIKQNNKLLNSIDKNKSNFLKYKVLINKMNKNEENYTKKSKGNSKFSKEEQLQNFTK